jgi:hypothetical protein
MATVLDWIGQAHRRFRHDLRYPTLLGGSHPLLLSGARSLGPCSLAVQLDGLGLGLATFCKLASLTPTLTPVGWSSPPRGPRQGPRQPGRGRWPSGCRVRSGPDGRAPGPAPAG